MGNRSEANVGSLAPTDTANGSPLFLWAVVAAVTAGLLVFSQTLAGEEALHLLAAQLINAGKRPYLDFFYQQEPLYPYLLAGWFRIFGDSWRSVYGLSALLTGASVLLVAGFVFARVQEAGWRLAAALTAALLMGLHALVIQFGTIGHPYGLVLLLIVAAFRLVIGAVERDTGWLPFWAGLCAGAAAASSLLAAPVAPIVLLWMVRRNRVGSRRRKCTWFLAGAALPFLPLLWLAAQAPRQAWFDIVGYHLYYPGLRVSSVAEEVWEAVTTLYSHWLESTQGLVLVLLAAVGLLFVGGRSEWEVPRRAEFALCAWLVGGLGVYLALTPSTRPQYFVLVIPFLTILASVGVYAIGSRICIPARPGWPVLLVVGLFAVGLARQAYHMQVRQQLSPLWPYFEDIAQEVNRVTPRDGQVWVDLDCTECLYFAARRVPPPGLENIYARGLPVPSALATSLKIVPQSQQDEWLATGRFDTVVIGVGDTRTEALGLPRLYAGRKRVDDVEIYWGRGGPGGKSR